MACLTGIVRRYNNELASRPRLLVAELPPELEPTLVQNGLVQAGLSPHIPAGTLHRTRRRSGHVPHLQIFHYDYSMVFADGCGSFVQKIIADVGYFFVQSLQFCFLLSPIGGKFDFAGQSACSLTNFFSCFLNERRGLSIAPSDRAAKQAMPISMPTLEEEGCTGSGTSRSVWMETYHFPADAETVT